MAQATMTAEQIKKLRKRLGCTQQALAFALNVHSMTVSKWERGVTSPDPQHVMNMRAILKGKQ